MAEKYLEEKRRLRDYMIARGIEYDPKLKTWRCPGHDDATPSAHLYEDNIPRLYCPVCGNNKTWSVFEVAGLLNGLTEFKDKLKNVRDVLGIMPPPPPQKQPVALSLDEARKVYTEDAVLKLTAGKISGKIAGRWPYHTQTGDIIGIDIRFEGDTIHGNKKKIVLTFWYDGKSLRFAKAPVLIYNLPEIVKSEKPILLNEGAKKGEIACKNMTAFTGSAWSGGSGKAQLVDWSVFNGKDVYIFRDDDDPGLKAASKIVAAIPHAKIVRPVAGARALKQKGADIEEALQIMSPDEITAYILNPDNHELPETAPEPTMAPATASEGVPPPSTSGAVSESSLPFKILGIGDDGRAAFISEAGRLVKYGLDGLSKSKLMVLAGRWFWRENYSSDGKMSWDWAIDEIIRFSQNKDFNESDVRGRGAWRDGKKISYHDGIKTQGEHDDKKLYLRLPQHDIGINDDPAGPDLCRAVKDIIFKLSFESRADAVRALSWAALAPFAGALKFRPAILLTGPSGSGKTTVTNLCIRRLADCEWFNGSESTVPGVRGKIKHDSRGVMFEETEVDTEKKKNNRNELFSLMRVSVSDDAPDTVKGTKEGGYNSYKMQNMFGFIAIDPTIESVADENRIFRINMIKPTNGGEWKSIEKSLIGLLSDANCRAIRALTWKKLKCIFDLSDRVVDFIREKTGRDYRSSYADAMLCSAFMIIWSGIDAPTDAVINETLDRYYQFQPAEEHRDEAEEFIDRILEEPIEILHDGSREKISILECMNRVCTEGIMEGDDGYYTPTHRNNYRLALSRSGIIIQSRSLEAGEIAIANNHFMIKKITGHMTGYNRIFKRWHGYVDGGRNIHFLDGKVRRSTVLKGLLVKSEKKSGVTVNDIPVEEFDFQ